MPDAPSYSLAPYPIVPSGVMNGARARDGELRIPAQMSPCIDFGIPLTQPSAFTSSHITPRYLSGIVGPIVDRQYSPLEVNTDITTF
jgi:hypothetical protein